MGGADSKPKKEDFYDVVLHCSPSLLCLKDGVWTAELSSSVEKLIKDNEKLSGATVAILGNYNRGKTWILRRLAESASVQKDNAKTETGGLCLKWVQSTEGSITYRHIALDSAGTNSPINLASGTIKLHTVSSTILILGRGAEAHVPQGIN